jgi:hypothetical protein
MPKKESKVKITGKASTSGGAGANYGKSMKFNAFGQPMTVKDAPAKPGKKASSKYSPAPMSNKKKETTRRASEKKQAVTNIKKDLTKISGVAGKVAGKAAGLAKAKVKADIKVAKKVSNVAGKVAGKAVGAAKSKVKADIKAAKTVAGFAAKTAMSPVTGAKTVARFVAKQAMPPSSNPILKGAKAAGKAIAGDPLKNLIKAKKAKKK